MDSNDPPVNNEVLESFNLDVLNEFVSQSEINVYAPVFSKVEIFSPNEIGDDTVLGSFSPTIQKAQQFLMRS